MPTEKKEGGLANLKSLAQELPTKKKVRGPQLRLNSKKQSKPAKVEFPECFAEVNRLTTSKEPADARHRAALQAVASTLPADARLATGAKAAGIYLAALVTALRQVLSSIQKESGNVVEEQKKKEPQKKSKKKQKRLREMQSEQALLEMSFMQARAPQNNVEDAEMTALDSIPEAVPADSLSEDAHFVASIVYLILLACRAANRALVNAKATEILLPINSALALPAPSPLLARHAAGAITIVLTALNSTTWNAGSSHVSSSFINLLSIAASSAPKSRKKARECLVELQRKVPLSAFRAVCAPASVAWFIRVTSALFREASNKSEDTTKEVQGKKFALLLRHVTLVKYFAFVTSGLECAKLAKQILSIAQGSNLDILPFLYDTLSFLFCIPNNSAELSGVLSIQCARLIAEGLGSAVPVPKKLLGGEPPRISQTDALKLVEAVVASSLPASCPIEPRISRARALLTLAICTYEYYPHSPPPSSLTISVVEAMVNVIDPVSLSKLEVKRIADFLLVLVKRKEVQNVPGVFNLLVPFVSPKFNEHRNSLHPIFKEFISSGTFVNHSLSQDVLVQFLKSTLEERAKAISSNDRQTEMLMDGLLCAVVRGGAAPQLLKSVPLKWDANEHVTNAWVIGILRDNIRYAPLALWQNMLSSLHQKLESVAESMKGKKNQDVERKNLLMYSHQILALLPGLSTNPTDISQSQIMNIPFSAIEYCMNYPDSSVQLTGCNALRNLSESVSAAIGDREAFSSGLRSSFSSRLKKLYSAILNLAEKQNPEKRATLAQAVSSACIACADEGIVSNLLRKTVRRFLVATANKSDDEVDQMETEEGTGHSKSSRTRHAAADISIAIVESRRIPLDSQEYDLLKRAVLPMLDSKGDPTLQKKAYKTIATLVSAGICTASDESVKNLVTELGKSGSNLAAGALPSRLSLIKALIDVLSAAEDDQSEAIRFCTSSFLAEAVLALRGNSEKGRQMGTEVIKTIANAWAKSRNPQLGLNNFFIAIAAGFGGKSTAMVSGSLTAFASFLENFKEEIREQGSLRTLVESMLAQVSQSSDCEMKDSDTEYTQVRPGPVAILLRHDTLEVQKAAIGAVKSAIGPLGSPVEKLVRLLPGVLPGLISASADSKKKDIRLRVKVVIERLLRKCGREVMEGLFPDEHKRLLSSVRKELHKIERKRKRTSSSAPDAGGGANLELYSSDEEDDEDMEEAKRIRFK